MMKIWRTFFRSSGNTGCSAVSVTVSPAAVPMRLIYAGAEVGVGTKTENQKLEEKKRPNAVIKAIQGTVNKQKDRLGTSCSVQQIAAYFFLVGNCCTI